MKVLISACLLGKNVRWNATNKKDEDLIGWAEREGIQLISVCPENSVLGTPRPPIKLEKINETIIAHAKNLDVFKELTQECENISLEHPDAVGFIGIAGSPTCGISVGVRNLGRTIKGFLHQALSFPTTEINQLRSENNRKIFIERIKKFQKTL